MISKSSYWGYLAILLLLLAVAYSANAQQGYGISDYSGSEPLGLGMKTKPLNQIGGNLKDKKLYNMSSDKKTLYDTKKYSRNLPLYDTQKYSRSLPLYDTQKYSRSLPLYDTQKYSRSLPLYDIQEYVKDLPLYNAQTKTKNLRELGGDENEVYNILKETCSKSLKNTSVNVVDLNFKEKPLREI